MESEYFDEFSEVSEYVYNSVRKALARSAQNHLIHSVTCTFNFTVQDEPSTATHTMIVDPDGNAHYNDYPDKERTPEMYG